MAKKNYPRHFAHPRYWPTWLAIGALYGCAFLPWRLQLALGRGLGWLAYWLAPRRRHITEVNIDLCFPELSPAERRQLVKDSFAANGIGLMETAVAWFRDPRRMRSRVTFKGKEHLEKALAEGRGAIIMGVHYSTLDLGGALHSLFFDVDIVYRKHDNPLFEHVMTRARQKIFGHTIDRKDIRTAIKNLKAGRAVWYTPDQDFGRKASVFAPFFGHQAATLKMTTRLARVNQSPVLPIKFYRNRDNYTYTIEYLPPLQNYPSGDEVADATRTNAIIEQAIRRHPEQYLWMHRRFKTRPEGEPDPYQRHAAQR